MHWFTLVSAGFYVEFRRRFARHHQSMPPKGHRRALRTAQEAPQSDPEPSRGGLQKVPWVQKPRKTAYCRRFLAVRPNATSEPSRALEEPPRRAPGQPGRGQEALDPPGTILEQIWGDFPSISRSILPGAAYCEGSCNARRSTTPYLTGGCAPLRKLTHVDTSTHIIITLVYITKSTAGQRPRTKKRSYSSKKGTLPPTAQEKHSLPTCYLAHTTT